jgi:outer membrane lipoprotein
MKFEYGCAVLAACLLAGCASSPVSRPLLQAAERDITFELAAKGPEAYKGSLVIWGGYIVDAVNVSSGTELMVLDTPLTGADEPAPPETSTGRFLARLGRFLDPAIYVKGAKVTVAGRIDGWEMQPLGKIQYAYPVLKAEEIHLWPQEKPSHNTLQLGVGVGF